MGEVPHVPLSDCEYYHEAETTHTGGLHNAFPWLSRCRGVRSGLRGSGFRAEGLGFRVWGLGSKVGLGFRVKGGLGLRAKVGLGFKVV